MKNLIKSLKVNGLTPRLHGNTKRLLKHTLTMEEVKAIVVCYSNPPPPPPHTHTQKVHYIICIHRHFSPTIRRHMVFYCQAECQDTARQTSSCCPQACLSEGSGGSTRQQWLRVTGEQPPTAHSVDFGRHSCH